MEEMKECSTEDEGRVDSVGGGGGGGGPQVKWKNAFGFVYQVRKKLSNQPQVYNEFIDMMRRVHNRSVETWQVVAVISDLFRGHPDLIRGFNAFLPDKHKIDVKQAVVPDSATGDPQGLPITTRIIRFTLKVRKRFQDEEGRPEKYKRFVEVLYLYKALSQQLQGVRRCSKVLREEEVYAEVSKLFENNEDLLAEFSEYLPYNRRVSEMYRERYRGDGGPYNCTCCSDVGSGRGEEEVTSSDQGGSFPGLGAAESLLGDTGVSCYRDDEPPPPPPPRVKQEVLGFDDDPPFLSLRKPLTPFKVPLPPASNKLHQEVRIKRTIEEDEAARKRHDLLVGQCSPTPESPPPSDLDLETSVIARLSRRDEEVDPLADVDPLGAGDLGAGDLGVGDLGAASPPHLSSTRAPDRRLRNLRKRLRRLANL